MICPNHALGLRGVNPVRINRRTLHVINLPAGEVRAADLPAFAFAVRGQMNAPLRVPTRTRTPLIVCS